MVKDVPEPSGYHEAPPGQCSRVVSSDDWGWSLVRCAKPIHSKGKHISEGNRSFGGLPFTAIWSEGDDLAERYYHSVRGAMLEEQKEG